MVLDARHMCVKRRDEFRRRTNEIIDVGLYPS
jgi:hypothetical protein